MKPNRDPGLTVESTVTGEEVKMGIAKGAMVHIMGILTDMYPQPVLAVVREYATNAWDSHVAAGHDRPIDISLPSALRPVYTVRDYGVGLNADDIRELYSQYGASTKRDSDDVQGMLGIGSKSALAHTDQFTFTGIKDGIKTVASVSRDEEGVATMTITSETPTDEEQGVIVSVPAGGKEDEFEEHAREFFSYWNPDHVRIDGRPPKRVEGYELSDDMIVADWQGDRYSYREQRTMREARHVVVMGNVPYPVPEYANFNALKVPNNKRLIVWLPIGTVNFTPARDSLQQTAKTKATLERVKEDYMHNQAVSLQRNLDNAKTQAEAVQIIKDAYATFPGLVGSGHDLKWNGKPIPLAGFGKSVSTAPTYRAKYALSMEADATLIDVANAEVIITEFTNETWSGQMLGKLQAYLKHVKNRTWDYNGGSYSRTGSKVLMFRGKPNHAAWVPNAISWNDIRKWKPPGSQANVGGVQKAILGSYEVKKTGSWGVEEVTAEELAKRVKDGDPVVWERGGKYANTKDMQNWRVENPEGWIVVLNENRVTKFERILPDIPHVREVMGRRHKKWWAGLSREQKGAILSDLPYTMNTVDYDFKPSDTDDPLLKKYLSVRETKKRHGSKWSSASRYIGPVSAKDYPTLTNAEQATLRSRYPLLFGGRATRDHMRWYIQNVPRKETK